MERVTVERWRCAGGHLHDTEEAANHCEAKARLRAAIADRAERAVVLRDEGHSYAEIGRLLGRGDGGTGPLSDTRVSELVHKGYRKRRR